MEHRRIDFRAALLEFVQKRYPDKSAEEHAELVDRIIHRQSAQGYATMPDLGPIFDFVNSKIKKDMENQGHKSKYVPTYFRKMYGAELITTATRERLEPQYQPTTAKVVMPLTFSEN